MESVAFSTSRRKTTTYGTGDGGMKFEMVLVVVSWQMFVVLKIIKPISIEKRRNHVVSSPSHGTIRI